MNNRKLLIADFGLSKHLAAVSNSSTNMFGLIEYIEPQCFKIIGYKKDKRSDIYSLGVLLWEITSGYPPFSKNNSQQFLAYHIACDLQLREKPVDNTPLCYIELYRKCWNGDPNLRPNIDEVYDKLESQPTQSYHSIPSITSSDSGSSTECGSGSENLQIHSRNSQDGKNFFDIITYFM